MSLTKDQVEIIAQLARIKLTDEEKEKYAEQLSVVLDYMKLLNEVDVEGVEETCQVTGLEDVFREDKVEECDEDARNKLIEQFPNKVRNLLKVKAIFEKEEKV